LSELLSNRMLKLDVAEVASGVNTMESKTEGLNDRLDDL